MEANRRSTILRRAARAVRRHLNRGCCLVAALSAGIAAQGAPNDAASKTVSSRRAVELAGVWDSVPTLHAGSKHQSADFTPRGGCPAEIATHTDANFEGDSFNIQAGFAESEIAAASFTVSPADFPMTINLMEMIFAQNHFNPTVTQWSVLVWEGTPDSGTLIETFTSDDDILPHLTLPLLGSQAANVAVSVDPGDPAQVILTDNGSHTFSVGYRIDVHNNQTQDPCFVAPPASSNAFPTTDLSDLEAPTRNWLFGLDCGVLGCPPFGGWSTFQNLHVLCRPTGDWVLRVTYTPFDCADAGACCFSDGTCSLDDEADCIASGGSFEGIGTSCEPNPCPGPTGACCDGDAVCTDGVEQSQCQEAGSTHYPDQACVEVEPCSVPTGACCNGTGGCLNNRTRESCEEVLGWIYGGHGTNCLDDVCMLGACCLDDGSCVDNLASECTDIGGNYQGAETECGTAECPQPLGACCVGEICVEDQFEVDCSSVDGTWLGAFTDCGPPNPCVPELNMVAVASCMKHPEPTGAEHCLDLGLGDGGGSHGDNVEPRLAHIIRLKVTLDGPLADPVASVDCGAGPIAGVSASADGDVVTVSLDTPLAQLSCCELTLDGVNGGWSVISNESDVNQDGITNSTDFSAIKARFGQTTDGSNFRYDLNGDGIVNTLDSSAVKSRFGNQAPACP